MEDTGPRYGSVEDDAAQLSAAYSALKFCPECGRKLDNNPISWSKACFLHGDFDLTASNRIVWAFTRNVVKRP